MNLLDPEHKLNQLPLFWGILLLFSLAATASAVLIAYHSELTRDLTYRGFNFGLFTVFRVPLSILAAMIPILGLIAALHRSAQTNLQITKTEEQNIFANYYKHRQEFIEHINNVKTTFQPHIQQELDDWTIRRYYKDTYPNNSPINFAISGTIKWLDRIDKETSYLFHILSAMRTNDKAMLSQLWRLFEEQELFVRYRLLHQRKLDYIPGTPQTAKKIRIEYQNGGSYKITAIDPALKMLRSRIYDYADLIIELKSTAGKFKESMVYGSETGPTISGILKNHLLAMPVPDVNKGIIREIVDNNAVIKVGEKDIKNFDVKITKINKEHENYIFELKKVKQAGNQALY